MIKLWLRSILLQQITLQSPVCDRGEYSTIHFCDGIGPDIPKKKTTRCFIHCADMVTIQQDKMCTCEQNYRCLIVYCKKEPIVKLLESSGTRKSSKEQRKINRVKSATKLHDKKKSKSLPDRLLSKKQLESAHLESVEKSKNVVIVLTTAATQMLTQVPEKELITPKNLPKSVESTLLSAPITTKVPAVLPKGFRYAGQSRKDKKEILRSSTTLANVDTTQTLPIIETKPITKYPPNRGIYLPPSDRTTESLRKPEPDGLSLLESEIEGSGEYKEDYYLFEYGNVYEFQDFISDSISNDMDYELPSSSQKATSKNNRKRKEKKHQTNIISLQPSTPRERKIGAPVLKMAEATFVAKEDLFQNEKQFVKITDVDHSGKCDYIPNELNPGSCKFPLRNGERCRPSCAERNLVPFNAQDGNVQMECVCNQQSCQVKYDFRCVNACTEPDKSVIPIGLKPKCAFPLPGGESCNFDCIFGSFKTVQRAFGKCNCRNGDCSFSIPRASCAPSHSKYCRTDNALVEAHPMARVHCMGKPGTEHLSTFVTAKREQTCWLRCVSGFVWKTAIKIEQPSGQSEPRIEKSGYFSRQTSEKSPPISCSCQKKAVGCELQIPLGMCVPAAFADFEF